MGVQGLFCHLFVGLLAFVGVVVWVGLLVNVVGGSSTFMSFEGARNICAGCVAVMGVQVKLLAFSWLSGRCCWIRGLCLHA